jgi:hypothetical protein
MAPNRSVTTAASALVPGEAVSGRPFAQVITSRPIRVPGRPLQIDLEASASWPIVHRRTSPRCSSSVSSHAAEPATARISIEYHKRS